MIYKHRHQPSELPILGSLHTRMNLSSENKKYYYSLKKGWKGELLFDSFAKELTCDCLILNDLLLSSNNTAFQIDSLIITAETIFIYEVKNFAGDYYYESEKFYNMRGMEILNPLHQLNRTASLLRSMLSKQGFNLPMEYKVIFINESFTLYQAPINDTVIYPTQIRKYFHKLNAIPSKLTKRHRLLAEKLLELQLDDFLIKPNMPSYQYVQLQKGISCAKCHSLSVHENGRKCICTICKHEELTESAVVRAAKEFKLLFPNEKMTTGIVHDWCSIVESKRRIKYILYKNFNAVGKTRWLYYE
ncbi:nuclease-related domain-containing protein [Oceanobacillus sp. ISL-74]|uniref:nuclease-related domain-containing protein n=2 Tax=unclassified Oceanobacillus TaxID=2630292 RepID=UPI001BE8DAB8|nr:nuclease-related domain-containing protein [Oceanobacillus sp. ISL-74]MBT2599780.1 NERD domain-containing protein [Oceanobacillus sp. ISL-74]